jgi:thiol-disulfide isomerase/thioredoxin
MNVDSPIVIAVFHQAGCGHCEEYLPKFRRVASEYGPVLEDGKPTIGNPNGGIVSLIYDCDSKEKYDAYAAGFKVEATPTTLILRHNNYGGGLVRYESNMDEPQIHEMMRRAQAMMRELGFRA